MNKVSKAILLKEFIDERKVVTTNQLFIKFWEEFTLAELKETLLMMKLSGMIKKNIIFDKWYSIKEQQHS